MNMNITNTISGKKRAGFLAICAVLFAFTLMVIPAQVQAGGDEGDDYDTSGVNWGNSDYDTSGVNWGNSDYDTSGVNWGSNGYSSGGASDSGSNYYTYDTPTYKYYSPSSSGSGYTNYSTPTYKYNTSRGNGGSLASGYTPMTYVPYNSNKNTNTQGQSSSNKNTNTNNNSSKSTSASTASANNTNNISNTNNNQDITNNVNNNNISLVVYAAGATSTYSNVSDNNQQLDGYCVINPSTAEINQDLNFMAYPNGGNGSYTYSWSGTDGLTSTYQNFTGRYGTAGYKTAYVTIRSGSQIVTKTCSTTIVQRYTPPTGNSISAYCVATPSSVGINQTVTWNVYASGGNGNYGYYWSGTDSLFGYSQYIQKSYSYAGTKQASVTVTSGGQSITATCNADVTGGSVSNVNVYRQPTSGTPVSGVFLNQVPDTGINWSLKTTLFAAGLLMWSAFVAYMVIARRKQSLALASGTSKEAAFKLANMQKKGLIS
ncbi:MAG: hypothetical protein RL094_307 [Candidatus Parcubacteria bacterium]